MTGPIRKFGIAAAASAVFAITAVSCADITRAFSSDCAGVGFPAILVQLRRPDGRPIAPGAKLIVVDGTYRDSSDDYGDPLLLGTADNRKGTYTVEVTKPYYKSFKRDGVDVPGGGCGAYKTVVVPVVLEPLPGAPPIRSVSVRPNGLGIDVGRQWQFSAYVDAVPGADTSVTWSLSDPRVATIDTTGMLLTRCGAPQDIYVIATSRYDPTTRGTGRIGVYGTACP